MWHLLIFGMADNVIAGKGHRPLKLTFPMLLLLFLDKTKEKKEQLRTIFLFASKKI